MSTSRLSKEEALAFLLTHIVIERESSFEMNQLNLFTLMNLAAEAKQRIDSEEGCIPHEVIEESAVPFLESLR